MTPSPFLFIMQWLKTRCINSVYFYNLTFRIFFLFFFCPCYYVNLTCSVSVCSQIVVKRPIQYITFCLEDPLLYSYHFFSHLDFFNINNINVSHPAWLYGSKLFKEDLSKAHTLDKLFKVVHDCRMCNDPDLRSSAQGQGNIMINSLFSIYFKFSSFKTSDLKFK